MDAIAGYAKQYELWIYAATGLFALWHLRIFIQAWDELRGAAFGIERELAQTRLNQAASMLVFSLIIVVAEFSIVSFFAPALPDALPLPTPTLNLLTTPTLAPSATPENGAPAATSAITLEPTAGVSALSACAPGQVDITYPSNGSQVSGVVTLQGSATLENFGFYKYEIARPGDTVWLSINASEESVEEGPLGDWITTVLPPGEYLLRLMVSDNQGKFMPPCIVSITVLAPTPTP